MTRSCERCRRPAAEQAAVALRDERDDRDTVIELWCLDECVERVVYGLDDPATSHRYLTHRIIIFNEG